MTPAPDHGFRAVGGVDADRRVTLWPAAFAAHAGRDPRSEPDRPAFLSMFTFPGPDLRRRLAGDGCTLDMRGYDGPCHAPWVWADIDRADDLAAALDAARGLAATALHGPFRELDEDDVLAFFSGSKGFHLGFPTAPVGPAPGPRFNRACKAFAGRLAAAARVTIDAGVYDKPRLFRAPNSRHPKTGLHKRRLTHRELMGLTPDRVLTLAAHPAPFDVPEVTAACPAAAALWAECEGAAERAEGAARRPGDPAFPLIQRATADLIHYADLPGKGERATRVLRAAANLTEAGCPADLVAALLDRPGRDCGLEPGELRRQVESGIALALRQKGG